MHRRRKTRTIARSKRERAWEAGGPFVALDEVGVSAIAGPITACALVLYPGTRISGVRDSKEIPTHEERQELASEISQSALDYAFGTASPSEVSELGTVRGGVLAMQRAVNKLDVIPNRIVSDFHHYDLSLPEGVPEIKIVKGDQKIYSIAAASILAKVERDCYMKDLALEFPEYGWHSGVGYRTPEHWAGLRRYGPTFYHRLAYIPDDLKYGRLFRKLAKRSQEEDLERLQAFTADWW